MGKCVYCDQPAITNLDSEDLCQRHADAWVRSEGMAAAEDLSKEYPDCGGEGWFKADDGALVVCYGDKCH